MLCGSSFGKLEKSSNDYANVSTSGANSRSAPSA
jgi:hypothetical protein